MAKKVEYSKREQKEKIQADIEAFLQKGGQIDKVPSASEAYQAENSEHSKKLDLSNLI